MSVQKPAGRGIVGTLRLSAIRGRFVKRISFLVFAIVGVVALAQAQTQTQGQHGTQSSPAPVEGRSGRSSRCTSMVSDLIWRRSLNGMSQDN